MPAPHHSVFTGQMPFLPPNQQCQSTEGLWSVVVVATEISPTTSRRRRHPAIFIQPAVSLDMGDCQQVRAVCRRGWHCASQMSSMLTNTHTHTHTPVQRPLFQDNLHSRYQEGKTSVDLNEARDDGVFGCSGISWTICKRSAPPCRQTTMPTHHHSIFYRPDALPGAQPTASKQ